MCRINFFMIWGRFEWTDGKSDFGFSSCGKEKCRVC